VFERKITNFGFRGVSFYARDINFENQSVAKQKKFSLLPTPVTVITSIRCRINHQDNRNTLSKNNTRGSRITSQKRFMRFEPHKNVAEILFEHDSVQIHTILKTQEAITKLR
jgi:hypothetical protein